MFVLKQSNVYPNKTTTALLRTINAAGIKLQRPPPPNSPLPLSLLIVSPSISQL